MPRPRSSVIDHAYAMDLRTRGVLCACVHLVNNGTLESGFACLAS